METTSHPKCLIGWDRKIARKKQENLRNCRMNRLEEQRLGQGLRLSKAFWREFLFHLVLK